METPRSNELGGNALQSSPLCQEVEASIPAVDCDDSSKRMFDVIIVSSGGVGSTSLFNTTKERVSSKLNSEGDLDDLKHRLFHVTSEHLADMVNRNTSVSCATRMFVFTFSNAAASIFSLYRREYHYYHNIKLHEEPFPDAIFPPDSLTYANGGIDYFNLEAHFHSWLLGGICSKTIPVVFLRSEGRHRPLVFEMLKSLLADPHNTIDPELHPLHTSESHYATDEETAESYGKMRQMYARFQTELDALGYMSVAFQGTLKRLI